ncbi:hypothetical protein DEU56DRAFT_747856, partial [Suillus clintonianus]|uniref:uncharacterized protein n=1 Tax=Suillus clintonianus TaxID=1904413 RepID=UPI001B882FE0
IPLKHHFHRIGKIDSPHCLICPNIDETIHHFLSGCPQYVCEYYFLENALIRDPHL